MITPECFLVLLLDFPCINDAFYMHFHAFLDEILKSFIEKLI